MPIRPLSNSRIKNNSASLLLQLLLCSSKPILVSSLSKDAGTATIPTWLPQPLNSLSTKTYQWLRSQLQLFLSKHKHKLPHIIAISRSQPSPCPRPLRCSMRKVTTYNLYNSSNNTCSFPSTRSSSSLQYTTSAPWIRGRQCSDEKCFQLYNNVPIMMS